jgi:hypothetical protein
LHGNTLLRRGKKTRFLPLETFPKGSSFARVNAICFTARQARFRQIGPRRSSIRRPKSPP